MKRIVGVKLPVLILVVLVASLFAVFRVMTPVAGQVADNREYVCPPCNCGRDHEVFGQAGSCPACGMALVEKGSEAARPQHSEQQQERKRVAILVFDGVQIIDYTGPYEVFGQAGFNVYTVAARDSITTAMGMKVSPTYGLDKSPAPDVLVIPGGGVTRTHEDPAVIKWIQDNAKEADHVLSVCNGAFILAKAGLLDGLSATTFYDLIDGFAAFAPKTKVVTDQRYVDNGKIITTAGISSGIDGSLYLVSKMRGRAAAQMVALNMEYDWRPDSQYARASFADRHLRRIFSRQLRFALPSGVRLKVLSTEGGPDHWEVRWQADEKVSTREVIETLNDRLAVDGKWTRQDAGESANGTGSNWTFGDEKGAPWNGRVSIEPAEGKLTVALKINRQGSQR